MLSHTPPQTSKLVLHIELSGPGIVGLLYATIQSGKASALTAQHSDYVGKVQSYEDQNKIYADYEKALSPLRTQLTETRQQLSLDINTVSRYREIASSSQDPLQTARTIKKKFDEEKTQFAVLSTKIGQFERDLKNRLELKKQENTLSGQIKTLQTQHDALDRGSLHQLKFVSRSSHRRGHDFRSRQRVALELESEQRERRPVHFQRRNLRIPV